MTGKKKYIIVLVLLLFIGLGIFTFAAPSGDTEGNSTGSNQNIGQVTDGDDETESASNTTTDNNSQTGGNTVQNGNVGNTNQTGGNTENNTPTTPAISKEEALALAQDAVKNAEELLNDEAYQNAIGFVGQLDEAEEEKEGLESRLEEVKNSIDVKALVAVLKQMTTEAENKKEMDEARDYRTDEQIVAKVDNLVNETLQGELETVLEELAVLLDDSNGPKFNIDDGAILKDFTTIEVEDAEGNEIISLILVDEDKNETEVTEGLEVADGTYTLVAMDESYNEGKVTFTIDTKAAKEVSTNMYTDGYLEEIEKDEKNYKVYYATNGNKITAYVRLNEQLANVPTITFHVDGKDYTLADVKESFHNDSDKENGIYKYQATLLVEESLDLADKEVSLTISNIVDKAGNKTNDIKKVTNLNSVVIDRTAAEVVSLTQVYEAKENGRIKATVVFSEAVEYPFDSLNWRKVSETEYYTYFYRTKDYTIKFNDLAGNENSYKFSIDKTAPKVVSVTQKYEAKENGRIKTTVVFDEAVKYPFDSLNWRKVSETEYYTYFYRTKDYTINFTDEIGNPNSYTLSIDKTAPEYSAMAILGGKHTTENGEVVRYATNGHTITVNVVFQEKLAVSPKLLINDKIEVNFNNGIKRESGYIYSANYTLTEGDGLADGLVQIKVSGYADEIGNVGEILTNDDLTVGGQKKVYIDRTPVKVTALRFQALGGKFVENPYIWYAKTGNKILVYLNTAEELLTMPTVKIGKQEVTMNFIRLADDGSYFYGAGYTLVDGDGFADGLVQFEITGVKDFVGNTITLTNENGTLDSQKVVIVDRNAPVVTLNGDAVMNIEAGIDEYIEKYATVTDTVDGVTENVIYKEIKWYKYDETAGGDHYVYQGIVKDNKVNTKVPGRYNVIYWAEDAAGNVSKKVTRIVYVKDTTPATITIPFTAGLNKNEMIIASGDTVTLEDVMAKVTDNVDATVKIKPIRADLLISNDPSENTYNYDFETLGFKTNYKGRYNLYYEYEDAAGNISKAGMMIIMKDKVAPTVRFTKLNKYLKVDEINPVEVNGKLYFSQPVTVSFGDNVNIETLGYNDWENVEGNIKRTAWAKNVTTLGEHTVYVIDSSGNKTSVTFTIIENNLTVENGVMEITDDTLLVDDSIYYDATGDGEKGNIINASGNIVINGNNKTVTMATANQYPYMEWDTGYKAPAMTNIFASKNGTVTVNDLTLKGRITANTLGWYATPHGKNVLSNVNIIDAEVVSFSQVASALIVYGEAELNNTNIYGTKMSSMDIAGFPLYDLSVVNDTNTTINGGKIGSIYTWNRLKMTIKNAEIGTIYSQVDTRGELVIDAGTTVENLIVTAYKTADKEFTPKVTIKSGAVIEVLDLSQTSFKDSVVIEAGAVVKSTIN